MKKIIKHIAFFVLVASLLFGAVIRPMAGESESVKYKKQLEIAAGLPQQQGDQDIAGNIKLFGQLLGEALNGIDNKLEKYDVADLLLKLMKPNKSVFFKMLLDQATKSVIDNINEFLLVDGEFTLLHMAACLGRGKCVDCLLSKGAMNIASSEGITPLDMALDQGYEDIIRKLKQNKAAEQQTGLVMRASVMRTAKKMPKKRKEQNRQKRIQLEQEEAQLNELEALEQQQQAQLDQQRRQEEQEHQAQLRELEESLKQECDLRRQSEQKKLQKKESHEALYAGWKRNAIFVTSAVALTACAYFVYRYFTKSTKRI